MPSLPGTSPEPKGGSSERPVGGGSAYVTKQQGAAYRGGQRGEGEQRPSSGQVLSVIAIFTSSWAVLEGVRHQGQDSQARMKLTTS
jgi:hypothetical protein